MKPRTEHDQEPFDFFTSSHCQDLHCLLPSEELEKWVLEQLCQASRGNAGNPEESPPLHKAKKKKSYSIPTLNMVCRNTFQTKKSKREIKARNEETSHH